MLRLICFIGIFFTTAIFGWWMFFPLAVIYAYSAKMPYELVLIGGVLDQAYYIGGGFFFEHLFLIFSVFLLIMSVFLEKKFQWKKWM